MPEIVTHLFRPSAHVGRFVAFAVTILKVTPSVRSSAEQQLHEKRKGAR